MLEISTFSRREYRCRLYKQVSLDLNLLTSHAFSAASSFELFSSRLSSLPGRLLKLSFIFTRSFSLIWIGLDLLLKRDSSWLLDWLTYVHKARTKGKKRNESKTKKASHDRNCQYLHLKGYSGGAKNLHFTFFTDRSFLHVVIMQCFCIKLSHFAEQVMPLELVWEESEWFSKGTRLIWSRLYEQWLGVNWVYYGYASGNLSLTPLR